MSFQAEILVISPETGIRESIKSFLSLNGYSINTFATGVEALGQASNREVDLFIVDIARNEIADFVVKFRQAVKKAGIILVAEDFQEAEKLKRLPIQVDGYLFKPLRQPEVRNETERVLRALIPVERKVVKDEAESVQYSSRNPQMAELYDAAVTKIAQSESTVLITGESGTGKELMAYWIYANSRRKDRPFIKVSCAVLPEGVLESELFGHEKGAFTGAYTKRKGRFELADGGTIFLDEIGEIPPSIQSKFLRVLQEREFQRVGSSQTIRVNVRIIAATSRDLKKEVEEGHFREDLYYRLNVINIPIPPLRERREDIPELAELFLRKYARQAGKNIAGLEDKAMRLLTAYDFPGNVRELENTIEWAVVMAEGDIIRADNLPSSIIRQLAEEAPADKTLREAREDFERDYVEDTLARFSGNVTRSSRYLGLARKNLQEKIKKYEIDVGRYR